MSSEDSPESCSTFLGLRMNPKPLREPLLLISTLLQLLHFPKKVIVVYNRYLYHLTYENSLHQCCLQAINLLPMHHYLLLHLKGQ